MTETQRRFNIPIETWNAAVDELYDLLVGVS